MKNYSLCAFFYLIIISSVVIIRQGVCSATEPLVIGTANYKDVEFNIMKAEIINIEPAIFGSPETTQMKLNGYLLVTLKLKNNSQTVINYKSTSFNQGPGKLSLDDELGGHYYRINAPSSDNQGMMLYPGESGQLVLAFQKPNPNAKRLILSFPKFNIWGMEEINLKAPDDFEVKIPIDCVVISVEKKEETPELTFGEEFKKEGVIIRITKAQIGSWTISNTEQFYGRKIESPEKKMGSMLAITYEVKNDTGTKKLNLSQGFVFQLTDEFDNKYSSYMKPDDYNEPGSSVKPEKFPSFYPDESYVDTVFFEVPVKSAKYLRLTMNASSVGLSGEIVVKIPISKIAH